MTDAVLNSPTIRAKPLRRRSPFRRKLFPYLLVGPAVVYLLGITLYPGIFAIWRSFYTGRFQLEYVGFENYAALFKDDAFWHSLSNTAIIGGLTLFIEFVIALTLAALVYRDPLVKGWRILFLLPMLFMPSAVAFMWKLLFNDGRVISDLFMRIGMIDSNIDFMGSTWPARTVSSSPTSGSGCPSSSSSSSPPCRGRTRRSRRQPASTARAGARSSSRSRCR
jgi:multiple sugar transport system permease protein